MSGLELIFQIYLSGNGLEPTEPSQMALGELEWIGASNSAVLFIRACVLPVFVVFFLSFFLCVCVCIYV